MKLLRAFVTLAIKGSYSNAAKELFLTQPALSKQIQTLEHLTGGELFARTPWREFDSIWSTDFFQKPMNFYNPILNF